jgi:uncharacterized membrane protein
MTTETDNARRTRRPPLFPRSEPPRLDQPRALRRSPNLRSQLNSDKFGQWSEDLARFFGTARYLGIQSFFVIVWILLNILVWTRSIHWDPYPFILLNLAFSTQAAYAAPLILLAQNRQADRDKVQIEQDRQREEQSIANTEYLAREVAALRLAVNEVATRDFVRSELQALLKEVDGVAPGHELERRRPAVGERGVGEAASGA